MGAAIALMFLAEAAATCAPADSHRLRAGATVVQAIVSVDPRVFDPTVAKPAASNQATEPAESGSTDPQEPQSDQPAEQCKALPTPIA